MSRETRVTVERGRIAQSEGARLADAQAVGLSPAMLGCLVEGGNLEEDGLLGCGKVEVHTAAAIAAAAGAIAEVAYQCCCSMAVEAAFALVLAHCPCMRDRLNPRFHLLQPGASHCTVSVVPLYFYLRRRSRCCVRLCYPESNAFATRSLRTRLLFRSSEL